MKKYILPLTILLIFTACSTKVKINKNSIEKRINELYRLTYNSSFKIDKKEALNFAKSAVLYSKFLANSYGVTTHPLIHNTLINLKIKQLHYQFIMEFSL